MIHYFLMGVLCATLSAFIVSLLYKWGAIEYMQVHGGEIVSELARCSFCLSFWANYIVALFMAIWTASVLPLSLPFFTTIITRKLL